MPITIIAPKPPPEPFYSHEDTKDTDLDSDAGGGGAGLDPQGDVDMLDTLLDPKSHSDPTLSIVTPGEVITTSTQYMRGHGTRLHPPTSSTIVSTVAGTITRTNKLLSVTPLRARYTPEVGDLVVGRIIEVQAKRWRVDVNATQNASLPLSAINLPGGILRKRTEVDELAIRAFFSEGDLLVAEVQGLYADGAAVLHTRSLKFGKLRNGVFLAVSGQGGGGGAGGVVRSRRQTWTIEQPEGGGKALDVILGVNGYVWICMHVRGEGVTADSSKVGLNRLDDVGAAKNVYSSQNDYVDPDTMREISRIRNVIVALVEHGLRVDEDMVMKGYREAVELAKERGDGSDVYLGGDHGRRLALVLTGR